MTTLGSQAVQDVYKTGIQVVAAFKGDPVRAELHPVQLKALEDLEAACRFVYELTTGTRSDEA